MSNSHSEGSPPSNPIARYSSLSGGPGWSNGTTTGSQKPPSYNSDPVSTDPVDSHLSGVAPYTAPEAQDGLGTPRVVEHRVVVDSIPAAMSAPDRRHRGPGKGTLLFGLAAVAAVSVGLEFKGCFSGAKGRQRANISVQTYMGRVQFDGAERVDFAPGGANARLELCTGAPFVSGCIPGSYHHITEGQTGVVQILQSNPDGHAISLSPYPLRSSAQSNIYTPPSLAASTSSTATSAIKPDKQAATPNNSLQYGVIANVNVQDQQVQVASMTCVQTNSGGCNVDATRSLDSKILNLLPFTWLAKDVGVLKALIAIPIFGEIGQFIDGLTGNDTKQMAAATETLRVASQLQFGVDCGKNLLSIGNMTKGYKLIVRNRLRNFVQLSEGINDQRAVSIYRMAANHILIHFVDSSGNTATQMEVESVLPAAPDPKKLSKAFTTSILDGSVTIAPSLGCVVRYTTSAADKQQAVQAPQLAQAAGAGSNLN